MITLEEWVDIKALHKQGLSIKAIARRCSISRNTVRKALREGPPHYERPQRASKLDPFKDYLIQRLECFPELCAITLFEEIKAMGYTGAITILKDFTRPYRVRRREPIVRFETGPGVQAQVDWGELGKITMNGAPTKLYLFVYVLGYSRAIYAEVVTSNDTLTLIECHRRAFIYLGGVPHEILYDNMKQVVIKRDAGGAHRFNETLLDFAGTYGFIPKLCRPYRAKTKGKVERAIGYIKDRFFCGRIFTSIEDINAQLIGWIETHANKRIHATTGDAPINRLASESLIPYTHALPHVDKAKRPLFIFDEAALPEVQVRELSIYEELTRA